MRIVMNKATQFNRRCEQLYIRLAPLGSIHQLVGIIENTLQPAKTGILAQYLPLFGSLRCASANTEIQDKPDSFDIVSHSL